MPQTHIPIPAATRQDVTTPCSLSARTRLWVGVRQALVLAVIMFASLGMYLLVEWWRGSSPYSIVTQTEWDRAIPFYPGWVWVYMVPYIIGPAVIGLISPATFAWYVRRGIPLVLVSLLIFAVVPTRTVRPDASHLGDGMTADVYRNMVAIDDPGANAAPSLHVSLTCLLALALLRDFPRWWILSLSAVAIVWLSTLLTHQHHLIDVATGILLTMVVALPVGRKQPS